MGAVAAGALALLLLAQSGDPAPPAPEEDALSADAQEQEAPPGEGAGQEKSGDSEPGESREETVVVTASRSAQKLMLAPASVAVLDAEMLETSADTDMADVMRRVPGVNVVRLSARDMNIQARGATSSIDSSMLVLVDGRSIYLDFFGFVMWDLIPSDREEIERIEVVRGPGSAVWGANATAGVVNVITKDPEQIDDQVKVGGGELDARWAGVLASGAGERSSWKASASYLEQDAWPRDTSPFPSGWEPPEFENEGTEQPRMNFRLDRKLEGGATLRWGIGGASTSGIFHSGIGPFDIEQGSQLLYSQLRWEREGAMAGLFLNALDGEATNLLNGLGFTFETYTLDAEARFDRTLGPRGRLVWGGSARHNEFDLTLGPDGSRRDEAGAFGQLEWALGGGSILYLGGRLDWVDRIGVVPSPRITYLAEPRRGHTIRASYGQAFHAPSFLMQYIDVEFENIIQLGTFELRFPTHVEGKRDLNESRVESAEVGYRMGLGRSFYLDTAAYWTRERKVQDLYASEYYSEDDPPPGWTLPPDWVPEETLPKSYTYRNLATVEDIGFELGLEASWGRGWSGHVTYSWQDMPRVSSLKEATDYNENFPARHRLSFGADYHGKRLIASASLHYSDRAYWTDVLDPRFYAWTDTWWRFNARVTWRNPGDTFRWSVGGTNLWNDQTPQHAFGDLIGRQVTTGLKWRF